MAPSIVCLWPNIATPLYTVSFLEFDYAMGGAAGAIMSISANSLANHTPKPKRNTFLMNCRLNGFLYKSWVNHTHFPTKVFSVVFMSFMSIDAFLLAQTCGTIFFKDMIKASVGWCGWWSLLVVIVGISWT